jgi:membrane protein YqaA with SNARE-associated domain
VSEGVERASPRLQRAFTRLHDAAERGWAATATYAYGVLQSFVVPGLSDAFFLPLSLAHPQRAYRLAAAAALGTLTGAAALYWVGANALASLTDTIGAFVGVTDAGLTRAEALLTRWGWLLIVGSTFSPISTKLLAASAGAFGMPFPLFIAALGLSRVARVFAFAWAIRKFGARAVREAFGLVEEGQA